MSNTYLPSNIVSLTQFRASSTGESSTEFEEAFENLTTSFQMTIRQLERFAREVEDVPKLRFIDEIISALQFFDLRSEDLPPVTLPGVDLIETAIELCDCSAEAEFVFGEKNLAFRLKKLSESCYEAYHVLPESWKDNQGRSIPLPSLSVAMAA